jgi:hypothetical protein
MWFTGNTFVDVVFFGEMALVAILFLLMFIGCFVD